MFGLPGPPEKVPISISSKSPLALKMCSSVKVGETSRMKWLVSPAGWLNS